MDDYILVSNNPLIKEKTDNSLLGENINIKLIYLDSLDDVMLKSRDLIHKGYDLISHPLAGSVKPAQNPYRSIILQEGKKLNYKSLKSIENAIQKLRQFQKNKNNIEYPAEILEDYQVIDHSLISSGINSLK